jgi:magnesium transporter
MSISSMRGLKNQTHSGVTWVDVENPDSEVFARLEREYKLHPLQLHESIQKVQHIQVEKEANYLFLVLHYPVVDSTTAKISTGQIGVFLSQDYLITVHSEPTLFLQGLYAECEHGDEQARKHFGHDAAYLLYELIHRLLDTISNMAEQIDDELDGLETVVFNNATSDAQRIGIIRQKIVRLRRLIGPKRIVLQDLAEQVHSFAPQDVSRYYASNVKFVNKLWESIEEAKETVEIYKDADFITSTEKTNKILMLLTLVFTFTIPITMVGTLYGMNVLLPGGIQAGNWSFLGHYTTLWVIVIASGLFALGMYIYFKLRKWF